MQEETHTCAVSFLREALVITSHVPSTDERTRREDIGNLGREVNATGERAGGIC